MLNRRDTLKISGAAALGMLAAGEGAASTKKQAGEISVTGYAYDRVQAIKDGQVGVEANRKELELVMRYTHEQGLVKDRGNFMELFHPETVQLLG